MSYLKKNTCMLFIGSSIAMYFAAYHVYLLLLTTLSHKFAPSAPFLDYLCSGPLLVLSSSIPMTKGI